MSVEVPVAFVKQYAAGVRMLQQQKDSRLRSAVMVDDTIVGDREFFDQVDATVMNEVTNRHGDTEYTDTPHRRRMVTLKTYEVADLVDRADRRRLLNDPVNPYSRAMAAAANRRVDDVILASFDASASTGVDGATAVNFPAAFSNTEDGGAGSFATVDLTIARRILETEENEEDDGDHSWHIVCSAIAREKLLGDANLISSDFNTVKALVNGQVNTWLGLNFIKSQRAAIVTATAVRDVFVWVKASMQLAIGQEPRGFIDVLPQKRHSLQVRYELDAGATRMDEKGVVRILVDEDA
jgi:hypothetical protein